MDLEDFIVFNNILRLGSAAVRTNDGAEKFHSVKVNSGDGLLSGKCLLAYRLQSAATSIYSKRHYERQSSGPVFASDADRIAVHHRIYFPAAENKKNHSLKIGRYHRRYQHFCLIFLKGGLS